jgi:hypothetical protein
MAVMQIPHQVKVPGAEIAIRHEHDEDLQVALRDAFDWSGGS